MAKQDGLFLLEVLVDKVTFDKVPCFSNQEFRTCVTVECPSVPPLEICDDDPGVPKNSGTFNKAFNSGKSCLFSMKEDAITRSMSKFPVRVQVIKSLPCGCIPTKIIMGTVEIDMTKEFIETRNKFLEDPTAISFQALRDNFHLIGADGLHSGEISMYLRISCFGSQIVTKFRKTDGQIVIGKPDQDGRVDRSCDGSRTYQTANDPCACGASRSGAKDGPSMAEQVKGICPNTKLGTAICPHAKDEYNNTPCEIPDDPCYCCGARPIPKDPTACRNTDPYCLHIPKGRTKQFEELGTNLNGNELKIKVPANASIIKKLSQSNVMMQRPYVKSKEQPNKKDNKQSGCVAPCGKNQISLSLPSEKTCCRGPQPALTQFSCTTEGCKSVSKHGQAAALAQESGVRNPNVDCFVLKVSKTATVDDKKNTVEMELVTPKARDKQPPKESINSNTQSEFSCLCGVKRLKSHKKPTTCCH